MNRRADANPSYEACIARVSRADVHLESLNRLLRDFVKGGAYSVISHPDLNTFPPQQPGMIGFGPISLGQHGIDPWTREIVLTARVLKEPPSEAASLIIADVVNSLRAALDNLVWALSVRANGPPPEDPIPRGDPWRTVAFPVVLDKNRWKDATDVRLRFVDPALHTRFHRLQPFYRRKNRPERDPLAILDELWNIDKHRHLHLAESFLGLDGVKSNLQQFFANSPPATTVRITKAKLVGEPPEKPIELNAEERAEHHRRLVESAAQHGYSIIVQHPPGPFIDGAELGRVTEAGNTRMLMNPGMYVDPELTFDIAFEERSPAHGQRVIPTLTLLRDDVEAILTSFQSAL